MFFLAFDLIWNFEFINKNFVVLWKFISLIFFGSWQFNWNENWHHLGSRRLAEPGKNETDSSIFMMILNLDGVCFFFAVIVTWLLSFSWFDSPLLLLCFWSFIHSSLVYPYYLHIWRRRQRRQQRWQWRLLSEVP